MAQGMIMTHVMQMHFAFLVGICFVSKVVAVSGAGAAPLWGDVSITFFGEDVKLIQLQKDVPCHAAVRFAAVF